MGPSMPLAVSRAVSWFENLAEGTAVDLVVKELTGSLICNRRRRIRRDGPQIPAGKAGGGSGQSAILPPWGYYDREVGEHCKGRDDMVKMFKDHWDLGQDASLDARVQVAAIICSYTNAQARSQRCSRGRCRA